MRRLLIAAALVLSACASGELPSSLTRQAADRPGVVFSEEAGERASRLAIATAIRDDRSVADAAFAQTPTELGQKAAQLTRAKGHEAYALVQERVFEHGIERRSLDAIVREARALVREWTIEFGDPARPRGDGLVWRPAT